MAVSLSKGNRVSLEKVANDAGIQLSNVTVEMTWKERTTSGDPYDLDVQAFVLGTADSSGKRSVVGGNEGNFVFYGNLNAPNGKVRHHGDLRKGGVEKIDVDLLDFSADVDAVDITATIDKAVERKQTFGQVEGAVLKVTDTATGTELITYDLSEDFSMETAAVLVQFYRKNGTWSFNPIGQGYNSGLAGLCADRGVDAA